MATGSYRDRTLSAWCRTRDLRSARSACLRAVRHSRSPGVALAAAEWRERPSRAPLRPPVSVARRLRSLPAAESARSERKLSPGRSGAAAPEPAIAPQDERQRRLVSGPALVFRQLQLLLDRLPALAGLGLGLHRGRGVLQEREEGLR